MLHLSVAETVAESVIVTVTVAVDRGNRACYAGFGNKGYRHCLCYVDLLQLAADSAESVFVVCGHIA